jgi:epoxyqueuosine reductase
LGLKNKYIVSLATEYKKFDLIQHFYCQKQSHRARFLEQGKQIMDKKLQEWAISRGCRIAYGPAFVVEGVRRRISDQICGSEIDKGFSERELKGILGGEFDNVERSIVVIAKPRPAHLVHFDLNGTSFDALLPPTYFRYRALFEEVRLDLAKNGLPGAKIEMLGAPLKGVAAHLGLISYGRNNIAYVPGLGSYFQLCGYVTDAVLPQTELKPASLLEDCRNCGICIQLCPTGAIGEDRILLHAERCLTYANENAGEWPDWVDLLAHNSLLGCMDCQQCCPANPELKVEDTGVRFSNAETRLLLSQDLTNMSSGTENGIRSKLAWLGQPYVEPVLGRNLRALVRAKGLQI